MRGEAYTVVEGSIAPGSYFLPTSLSPILRVFLLGCRAQNIRAEGRMT